MIFKEYCIREIAEAVAHGIQFIGFGAGKRFMSLCEKYAAEDLAGMFSFLVDNDPAKWGTKRFVKGHWLEVRPLADALAYAKDAPILIMLTPVKFKNIWEQLYAIPELDASGVILPQAMEDRELFWQQERGAFAFEIPHDDRYAIPKIIHYCWFGGKPIPERNRKWMESWQQLCPDFEIREWNESNYDVRKEPFMAEAYDAKKWGFVSDYARLDILAKYGGFYLDTDVELLKSLDQLIAQPAFCGFEDCEHVNCGLGFGAIPQHPLLKALRDDYDGKHFLQEDGSYNMTPSPVYWTERLKNFDLRLDGTFQQLDGINIYPPTAFAPKSYASGQMLESEDTISIHHFDASWQDQEAREHHQLAMDLWKRCRANCPHLE